MKQYLKHLWLALTGCNPYSGELETYKEQMEKARVNMNSLYEQYYSALEKWEYATEMLAAAEDKIKNLRTLAEALRGRMEWQKRNYQQRLTGYNHKIDELTNKA